MPHWLPASLLLVIAAHAWRPPHARLSRSHLRPNTTTRHLHLFGWHLELQENLAIRSPYYKECKFYRGRVLFEDDSSVTVTECEGQLYGLLQVGKESFVLQPTSPGSNHVLRRRDVLPSEGRTAYNLTGDTVTELELEFENYNPMPYVSIGHSDDSETEYFRDIQPVTRPISGVKGLWLEMAIVADHSMLKFHGKERVEHYILALMNIVSAIFNDPSIDSNMTLVINKLFLNDDKDTLVKYGNVKKSLEAVNKWNYRHLNKLPKDTTGWDVAVWLTRVPLGGPSGFAPVGGVCTSMRSASINRDEGLTSAFVIAHELAHLLGLTHDGDDQCEKEAHRGTVMAPTVLATLQNFAWSSCSREQFHDKSKKWWCLHQRSHDEGVELGGAKALSNYVFTMDEQCRTEFGEGYSICRSVKVRSACSRLWCAHRAMPYVCRTKRAPPLEGTPCGNKRWCVDRVCEPMPGHGDNSKEKKPITPEWGEWGEWSKCSATCGYGLRARNRVCQYRGSPSEKSCEGASSQVMSCWAEVACGTPQDVRADLCLQRSMYLIPHIHPEESKQCELWCANKNGKEYTSYGTLEDGSPCSYERPYDVCFQGTCVTGQCNPADPTCNWCPDGYCKNNTYLYTSSIKDQGFRKIALIPQDANQLSFQINTPLALHVIFKWQWRHYQQNIDLKKHSKRVAIDYPQYNDVRYDPNTPQNLQIVQVEILERMEGSIVAAGAVLQWQQTKTKINITSKSKLQTDLTIMANSDDSRYKAFTVEVSVNYSTPERRIYPLEYRNFMYRIKRGPCSASCGGGIRAVRKYCPRWQPCPPTKHEPCNTHSCEFVWRTGEWEECSATCGDRGVQERLLYCVPSNISITSSMDVIGNIVSPTLCTSEEPSKQQPCNRVPCPAYWQELPWTPCSSTCGRGISRRSLICLERDPSLCGPKPRERRRRCRQRRCPTTCINPDSESCRYLELPRLCVIVSFRRICCNACQEFHIHNRRGG
ncbi:A disintegrin and metalloproteinase with thrombospondin motifs 1-like [Achroia grisella]|uniref:A disintegrin and metalloproteinase with thrombospondin motifs 1-like n=1 Tax=Achroia grisella TaxID=688607 RepID=UPI0027D21A6C|nr:A disintegrin and metalloproteinase with thrombospondin motifs 1-like [Achroia grisella]